MRIFLDDTIIAPATKVSKQAISIIRLSGRDAFNIVNKILKKDLDISNAQQLRKIYDNNQMIDEALFITFANSKSFTGENVVEINCHGGVLVCNKIINLLIKNGARAAQKGEFSQRAFLNGKINLLQSESINNLIESKNELALKISALGVSGIKDKKILKIKDQIIDVISRIQTSIDYPDYDDIEGSTPEEILITLKKIKDCFTNIIENSKRAIKVNDGIKTLIIGEPNVGKSSLLNALLNEEKAIVTDIEGTTRDFVEGQINFENFSLNLIDTAGIRKTKDPIEKIGIQKSLNNIDYADLILFVVNNENINKEILNKIKNKNYIIVVNKEDLLTKEQIKNIFSLNENIIFVSAINNQITNLTNRLKEMWDNEDLLNSDLPILTSIESIANLERALNLTNTSIENLEIGFDFDIVNVDLYKTLEIINNLLGIIDMDEEVIDNIFRKYCLGK
ncbi:tRNA modification GTPase TrmE [Spiroplasma tabanidicola]|uniref:tRNA modification GTPase MnmE n=1 Tax=Spiroplasma tabanidicola TaxID=324079 RepID=A0A6I6CA96_9MOLU|nr:tRNA uridine-5-carboxymethylaminomethyl(34) synthesis GTPase MnmE [Spiroplasma tabanidicola]QGS52466.1 tRNA modification GTPase TrmE [Spiroplasma tabanidicola]